MKLIIPVVNGFDEIELVTTAYILRKAGIETDIVGLTATMVDGKQKIRIMTEKRLGEVALRNYDGLIIIGGPGYETLARSSVLVDYIKSFVTQGKLVAAIGEAVAILAKNGLLDEKKAVIAPGMEKLLAYPRDQPVYTDQNIITSQAPGTAAQFALAIIKKLKGDAAAQMLKKELII